MAVGKTRAEPIGENEIGEPININHLPNEIFQMIFTNLLVKITWQQLIYYRKVCSRWRNNIDDCLKTVKTITVTHAPRPNNIRFINPPNMDMNVFESMLKFHPNLKYLFINDVTVDDSMSKMLVKYVPKLEKLELNNVKRLTWKSFITIGIKMKHISELGIEKCDLDESCLSMMICLLPLVKFHTMVPGIQTRFLCLNEFQPTIREIHINLNHIGDYTGIALKSLISGNGKNILRLGLKVHRYHEQEWDIIANNMQQLESFELAFYSFRSDNLDQFKKLINLKTLSLFEDMRKINMSVCNDDSLIPLFQSLKKLESVSLIGIRKPMLFTNLSISMLQLRCPQISKIRISNNRNIDNFALHILIQCRKLSVLEMNGINITNAGIKDLLDHSESISTVIIERCPRITEKIIDYFKETAKRRQTTKFKLYLRNVNVTNNAICLPNNLKIFVNF